MITFLYEEENDCNLNYWLWSLLAAGLTDRLMLKRGQEV